jgi:hypothetical protein
LKASKDPDFYPAQFRDDVCLGAGAKYFGADDLKAALSATPGLMI